MIVNFVRTIFMYVFAISMIRIMGKRQIGELEASELVVTIIVSQLACLPIECPTSSLISSIIGIFTIVSCEIISSYLAFKNQKFRTFIYGRPSIILEKGKMNVKEMENQRFNLNDLMQELRNKGLYSLSEVEYVILETNGTVSIILNSSSRNVTTEDLKIKVKPVELNYIIIDNGKLNTENLKHLNLDEKWIFEKLKENNLSKISDVFYMGVDKIKEVYLIKNDELK